MVSKTGTAGTEDLLGTSLDDILDGRLGVHRLYGLAGNDILYGGAGNDLLDGGAGNDAMYGGAGDDVYRVDSIGDVVSELNSQGLDSGGVDTIEASISYTLATYFEKLTLTGTAAINGTGNSADNRMKGNDFANVLSGMEGADNISGGGGSDVIIGGAGKDTLDGGSGADTFMFGIADATSTDRITDFNMAEGDKLGIMSIDYGLREGRGLISGNLDPAYFATVSGFSPQGTVAGHGQFLYNTSNYTLLWDKDGAGTVYSGVAIATFNSNIGLTASNIGTAMAVTDNNTGNIAPTAPTTAQFTTNVGIATPALAISATDANADQLSYSLTPGFEPQHGSVTFDQVAGTFTYKPTSTRPAATVPSYDHIVVVMEENKDYDQVIGNSLAPYLNGLAQSGALLTNYLPITHPSQPNYFALYAGTTFGITDDNHYSLSGPTLATTLQGAGKSFAGYVELKDGSFAHNPWESFSEGFSVERDFATLKTTNFADLPTVSFVIPNLNDDMHNGTVQQGDTWLHDNLDAYAQWAKANNSLLIVTYDEGNHSYPSPIPAVLYGANVVTGQYNAEYTHYNMLSTILGASGLTAPNTAANATPIDVFQQSAQGETGTDSFNITISDGYGGTTQQQVTITSQDFPSLPLVHSSARLVNSLDTSFGGPYDMGAIDPAGIVWVPAHGNHPGTLFMSDSEVDEPAATNGGFTGTNNLFALNDNLTPQVDPLRINPQQGSYKFDLSNFTVEPTGLAYNPLNGMMYISDDDQYKVFWVNPDDPTRKLGEFSVKPAGATDPEDIAINPNNGNIFISNGVPSHSITEVTSTGAFVSTTVVPDVVKDMEALAYDAEHDLFFVGGGFSSNIWIVNRAGTIVDTIDLSANTNPLFRNPISGTHVAVKDLAFAPSSDPNDDPNHMNLFVADYGLTHLAKDNDGRVLEIDLGWHLIA
jgi:hypothetical protein